MGPMVCPPIRRRIAALLGGCALALAVSACGGASDASVIARGNAICERAVAEIRAVPASVAGVSAAAKIVAKEARQLSALPRPPKDLTLLNRFISAERALSQSYAALAAAERTHDSAAATRAEAALAANGAAGLARRYGLSHCAAPGATVGS
jgi:hypothetical protein